MRDLYVSTNKFKCFISIFFLFMVMIGRAQNIQLKSFVVDEGLRKEILLINHYIKELKEKKIISNKPVFVRFEIGENPSGEIYNLRFLGNYYRNLSKGEELYYKTSEDIFYIFDRTAVNSLKNSVNFSLIMSNKNLKDYGFPNLDVGGATIEMGEMSFDKTCSKFYLNLVTGMPYIDLYYKIKFSADRGSVFYDTGKW